MAKNNAPSKKRISKDDLSVLKYVLAYTAKHYKFSVIVVAICIIIQAITTAVGMSL